MPALKRMIGDAAYGLRASQSHALLIGALVGLLGLTPGLRTQSAAPTDQAASKPAVAEKKKAAPELEPFDLSCVPAKAKSIMIFRPAAISRHRGMETSWEAVPLGPVLNLPVKGDEIEQVTSGFLRLGRCRGERCSGPAGFRVLGRSGGSRPGLEEGGHGIVQDPIRQAVRVGECRIRGSDLLQTPGPSAPHRRTRCVSTSRTPARLSWPVRIAFAV